MRKTLTILIWWCIAPIVMVAQDDGLKDIPTEVLPFVEKGTKAIAVESGDLNGDGRQDFILVLEKKNPEKDADGFPSGQRPLLILLRGADGKLSMAKRNERIVMCSECGGVFGDPFDGIEVGPRTFTLNFYGGSAWRWQNSYKFNYSRIDQTWQLVRAETRNYHTSDPNKVKTEIYTPPKDFGKIDIADFDPENYLKKGARQKTGK